MFLLPFYASGQTLFPVLLLHFERTFLCSAVAEWGDQTFERSRWEATESWFK